MKTNKHNTHPSFRGLKPDARCFATLSMAVMLTVFLLFPGTATGDIQQGIRSAENGNLENAVRYFRSAINRPEENKKGDVPPAAYLYLAGSLQELGRFSEALDALFTALALAEASEDYMLQTQAMTALGQVYLLAGNEKEADRYITASVERTGNNTDTALRAAVLNTLGNLYEGRSRYDNAITTYGEAAALAKKMGKKGLAAKVEVNLARVSIRMKRIDPAMDALRSVLHLADTLPDSHEKASVLIQTGRLLYIISQIRSSKYSAGDIILQAYNVLTAAKKIAGSIGDLRSISYAVGYLGELYESEHRYDEALSCARQAVFAAQKIGASDILYLWQWQTARIMEARNDIDGAISAYKRSLQNLDTIKKDLAEECHSNVRNRHSYYQTVGEIYFGLADLLLRRSATTRDPEQRRHDLLLARETIERLKTVEIQDYFQDDCVAAYISQSLNIETLAVTTAIVYPIVLKDRIEILLGFKDDILQFTVKIESRELLREVTTLRRQIEMLRGGYLTRAQRLYDWLIHPIDAELSRRNVDLLVFVLDSTLRSIPMAVLNDGKRFLIQKYPIATTLGLTLTSPQPLDGKNAKALLNGLTEGVQGFPPLPSVSEEMHYINSKFDGRLLKNQDFTRAGMEEALKQASYPIIHIASHGQFDSDPKNTFVLTYKEKLTMDELADLVSISRFRAEPVELLTLSACQTAIGDERAALGLAGVAVKAGARSALASLWFVADESTTELMEKFYENLSRFEGSKARALQQAQIDLLESNRFKHPAFWAPFILIGNWL